jgi:hypothetical protein
MCPKIDVMERECKNLEFGSDLNGALVQKGSLFESASSDLIRSMDISIPGLLAVRLQIFRRTLRCKMATCNTKNIYIRITLSSDSIIENFYRNITLYFM